MAVKVLTRVTSKPSRLCSRFHRVWKSKPVAINNTAHSATSIATSQPLTRAPIERDPNPRDAVCNAG